MQPRTTECDSLYGSLVVSHQNQISFPYQSAVVKLTPSGKEALDNLAVGFLV